MNDGDFVPFIPRPILKHVPNAECEPSATAARESVNENGTAETTGGLNQLQRVPQAREHPLLQGAQQPDESSQQACPDESSRPASADESRGQAHDEAPNACQEDSSAMRSTFSLALEEAIQSSTRDAEIRQAAVRLACIATGRILHHAVAFDPQIVARFVDDAIIAARRDDAFVRVNCVGHAASSKQGRSSREDARLDAGEVILDFPGGSLGATLEERAELTVRAAAND